MVVFTLIYHNPPVPADTNIDKDVLGTTTPVFLKSLRVNDAISPGMCYDSVLASAWEEWFQGLPLGHFLNPHNRESV